MFPISAITLLLVLTSIDFDHHETLVSWYGTEWSEYEDKVQDLWGIQTWQVDVNKSDIGDLYCLPGIDDSVALKIMASRSKQGPFMSQKDFETRTGIKDALFIDEGFLLFGKQPVEVRYQVRADRRYGSGAREDLGRYDGSALGITQRFSAAAGRLRMGALIDKDRYEPSVADLSRYYLAYRAPRVEIIAGDFNITTGYGIILMTRPVFFDGFDTKSAYIRRLNGIRPASETQENSAFRGLAAGYDLGGFHFDLFTAYTRLDALKDDDGRIFSLSDDGYHRTEKQAEKNDSVGETAFGGALRHTLKIEGKGSLNSFISGYVSRFDRRLEPDISSRNRFPLAGDRTGAVGFGGEWTANGDLLGGEVGFDYDRNSAWKVVYNRTGIGDYRWALRSTLFHYSVDYNNHHAGTPGIGSTSSNLTGAAVLLSGKCNLGPVRKLKSHLEIEQRPYRTWKVPKPFVSSRASVELACPLDQSGELTIRYRRKQDTEGHGEENEPENYVEDRLRFTWYGNLGKGAKPVRLKLWLESAGRWIETYNDYYGFAGGLRLSGSVAGFPTRFSQLRYAWSTCIFTTSRGLPVYLGETDLPDRFASVMLSGEGVRWAGSLALQQNRWNWLGIQVAKTSHTDFIKRAPASDSRRNDIEIYLTMSYYFKRSPGE